METETLRPELQNLAHNSNTPQHEILDTPASQLKQEPTVNHQPPQTNPNAPTPTPNQHPRTATQLPSPGSDDPTTQMGDVTESLQDPKPSSASTDPAPQMQTPQQKLKSQLPAPPTPVRSPCTSPQVVVEKPPTLDANKLPTRPFSFPHEDGLSSDEDDDYYRYYHTMLRRKSDAEMASPTPPSPVGVEQPKKPRSTRQSNSRVQKRRAREALREIPFSDPKYHKIVGAMVLRPTEIARDLATIYGREYKESTGGSSKATVRPNKRQRGSDAPTGSSGSHAKRLRQTNAIENDKNTTVGEVGRSTRYAKRSSGHVVSGGERGYQGSNKRQKTGGCSVGGGENEQKKMFEKHPDKKGWVVCKKCDAAVWPPNCGKHLFHCRKL